MTKQQDILLEILKKAYRPVDTHCADSKKEPSESDLNFDISENAIVEQLILKYESQNKRAGFLNEKSVKE